MIDLIIGFLIGFVICAIPAIAIIVDSYNRRVHLRKLLDKSIKVTTQWKRKAQELESDGESWKICRN